MTNITQIVTSAIIRSVHGKVLIVKRASNDSFPNMWEFPGGKSDFGEHPEESVKRESYEETGLSISPLFPVIINSFKSTKKATTVYVEIFYMSALDPQEQQVTLSEEHSEFAWIDFEEISQYPTTEYIHTVIEKVKRIPHV